MDVRLPDGTIIRNVPAGTTKAQLMAKLGKAPKGSLIGDALSSINEALIGGAEGVYNAASAVTDPIAKKVISLIQGPEAAEQAMQQANAGRRGVSDAASRAFVSRPMPVARDVGRIGGALAIPLPGKKLQEGGRLARTAYRAMQGAVGGAAVRDVDEDAAEPAAIGAAANVVLPPVISRIAQTAPAQAVARGVGSVAKPVVNYLTATADDAVKAIQSLQPTAERPLANLGREAEVRAARFKKLGVQPTTGIVTRDPSAYSAEQNLSKIEGGEALQQQLRDVETGLVEKGKELVRSQGGAKGPEVTGRAVQAALDAKRGEMQAVTSRLYDSVRETRGDDVVGELGSLRGLMDSPDMLDNAVFDQMRDSLGRRLSRLGGRDAMDDLPGDPTVTVRQAEELRKFIGGLGSTADPAVRMMRRNLIDALDDDVVEAVGDDAFKAARESAKARFAEFKKTFAGKIADEGVAPERLTKRVLSDTTSLADLRAMRKSLLQGTDEQASRGKEAWQGLRAQALEDLMGVATDADGRLVGSKLSTEFVKQQGKFRELLDPADYKQLRRLALATRDVKAYPQGHSVNTSGTATTLANMFQDAKPAVREGWLKFLVKHGVTAMGSAPVGAFPYANIALEGGSRVAAARANQKAADMLIRRIHMAQNPEAAAAAIAKMKSIAPSNPIVADFLQKYGASTGGAAAAEAR